MGQHMHIDSNRTLQELVKFGATGQQKNPCALAWHGVSENTCLQMDHISLDSGQQQL